MAPSPLTPQSGTSLLLKHPVAWIWTTHKGFIILVVPDEHPKPLFQTQGRGGPRMAPPRTTSQKDSLF